jgi:hypothetical protein
MAVRALSSSAASSFAQPAETATPAAGKAPKVKEFKIYRWVSMVGRGGEVRACMHACTHAMARLLLSARSFAAPECA